MSRDIPVSMLHEYFDLLPDGSLIRKKSAGTQAAGSLAGHKHCRGYRMVFVKKRGLLVHRIVWAMTHGVWPTGQIDHINGDRSDNRIENLRDVGQAINSQNLRAAKAGGTGFLGVSKSYGGRFRARITVDRQERHIGEFDTAEEAHTAYLKAKRLLHPGCTI